jgi:oligo-1,6-glucosidase
MQTTLGGTLFVYQGEEIGLRNAPLSWPTSEYKDIETINYWKKCEAIYADQPDKLAEARKIIQMKARDHARTPMQWDGGVNAGFAREGVTPWMRVMDDFETINAKAQMEEEPQGKGPLSVWRFWQRGLKDRKEHRDVFVYGDFEELAEGDENVFAYVRTSRETGERWVVVLNFSGKEQVFDNPLDVEFWAASTYTSGKPDKAASGKVVLRPWEGVLGKVKA